VTRRVVLATHNPHKVGEFQRIVADRLRGSSAVEIVAYDGPEPVEDGTSFAENALIKARAAAAHTGLPAIADDSGICVDVMGGAPGIFSAIWSGSHGDSEANRALLLAQLADIRDEDRTAHFTCVIAVVTPDGHERTVEGVWPGRITREAAGSGGFGYDPIFVPDGAVVSAAEMPAERKDADSHRARAFAAVAPVLSELV
jgi:XTP/dITP diphosphohydrolase